MPLAPGALEKARWSQEIVNFPGKLCAEMEGEGDVRRGRRARRCRGIAKDGDYRRILGRRELREWPTAHAGGTAAIVGARLVTMNGDEVIEDGTVVWQDGRITAVGARASVAVPDAAHVIDGADLTVIPGLIDAHAHGSMADSGIVPEQNWIQLSNLSFGVTTIHDPSNDTETIFAASELQKAGQLVAPRIFSTGTILYGARAPGIYADVSSLDDALRHLRRRAAVGAVSVKSYNQPRRDQRQQGRGAAVRAYVPAE